jgi:uncharacterized membrane protein YidH (DUF202 family)
MDDGSKLEDIQYLSDTELVGERVLPPQQQTLMSWVKTSVSMVSLSLAIYKFFHDAGRRSEWQQHLPASRIPANDLYRFWPSGSRRRTDPAS